MFVRVRCLAVIGCVALLIGDRTNAAGPVEKANPSRPADGTRVDAHGDPLPAGARARLGTVRFRHGSVVLRLAASADGKRFATVGQDHHLRLWDAVSGQEIRAIPFNNGEGAQSLAFSPNGRVLLAAVSDTAIHLWDTATGDPINTFENTNAVVATAAWSPDGKTIVTTDHTDTVRIWDVATGKEARQLKWTPPAKEVNKKKGDTGILGLLRWYAKKLEELDENAGPAAPLVYNAANATFSPDGKYLAACGPLVENGPVLQQHFRIWEVGSWKSIREWSTPGAHGQPRLHYSPDGKVLAATDVQELLHQFDPASGKELRTLGEAGVAAFAFSPDGKTLALTGQQDTVHLFDVETGKETRVLQGQPQGQMTLTFTADGRRLAAAGVNNQIHFWDLATSKAVSPFGGHGSMVVNAFTAAEGKQIVTCGADGSVRIWETATGRQIRELAPLAEAGMFPLHTFAVSSDGKRLARGSARLDQMTNMFADGHIHLFDLNTGKEALKLPLGQRMPTALEFTADGRRLAAALNGGVQVWDVQTGKPIRHLASEVPKVVEDVPPEEAVAQVSAAIAFSPDGRLLLTVDNSNLVPGMPAGVNVPALELLRETGEVEERTVTIWEMATGKKRRQFTVESSPAVIDPGLVIDPRGRAMPTSASMTPSAAIRFAPRGKAFLLGGGSNVLLCDLARGTEVRRFGGALVHGPSAAFSPDGKLLAAGAHDGRIYLWEVKTGTLLRRTPGHRGTVNQVTFSPDGQTLITAGTDTTGLVWDVAVLLTRPEAASAALSPKRLKSLWEQLGNMEADKSESAIQALCAVPTDAVPYLATQLKPHTMKLDAGDVDRLIKELDGATFDAREKAMKDLERLERAAERALRKALAEPQTSLELRRRMERLIERLDAPVTEPERLRDLRGVEVLELIATPEAKEVLGRLAKGTPGLALTREAKAALARLK